MPASTKTSDSRDRDPGQPGSAVKDSIHEVSPWTVIRNRRRILKNPLPFHHQKFEEYGDTFKIKITRTTRGVFTRDPIIVRHILQKNHRNYAKSELQTDAR